MKEALILGPILGIATVFQVFAQQGPDANLNPNVIVGLLGNAGIVGALIWYMWYHTTKSAPKMLDTFSVQLDKQRDDADKKIDRLRETFEREMARQREHSARETDELRKILMETMRSMRVAVHEVRDAANAAIQESNKVVVAASKSDSKH